jgi:hypothetical protein
VRTQNYLPNKIATNLDYYLTEGKNTKSNSGFIPDRGLPAYNASGYEAAYLASDGLLSFPAIKLPIVVSKIEQQRRIPKPIIPTFTAADFEDEQPSCGSLDEAYDLFILRRKKP